MKAALAFIHKVNEIIINPLIVLIFAAAVLVFLWGVFQYIKGADSESERATGRNHILAGVFGMFIMVSVFGIINLILNTIGATSSESGVDQIIGG